MKNTHFAAICLFFLVFNACSRNNEQVLVRFQNTLDHDITDATYEIYDGSISQLGILTAGTTSDYIPIDDFKVSSYSDVEDGSPYGVIRGKLQDGEFTATNGHWCGTGLKYFQLESGLYTVVISNVGSVDYDYYILKFAE